ncbi:conjugal transfer protein TraL [Kingella kingae]|uniref:nucleotide-binding protein n=1 Tax=Kingella kingae TaxID=504 RepID=UPI000E02F21C|nr:conjugal transfer protein TraL [Kingella kingae]QIP46940.1 conjugal transfer protein TraL [Kingella kingae]STR01121.1 conjugal transfer protein TraL [Kingella kingae]
MQEVHMIAQGKGGVGKSFISTLIAQYLQPKATQLHCYDTDPVNPTFSQYQALQPKVVNILTEDNNINTRFFDDLLENLFNLDGIAVVDNGAATFVPLMAYMAENDVAEMLAENGVCLVVHIPVTGGQALSECLKGLNQTLNTMNAEIVVWLNEYNGKIEQNGESFEQFGVYKQNQNRILGTILLESFSADTYGHDIAQMTSLNLTFDEVKVSDHFRIMAKNRLKKYKEYVFEQLDDLPLTDAEMNHELAFKSE